MPSIPRYSYIRENFRALIKQGELKAGDIIPPERDLCRKFGVSRMTVRQALADLVNERLIYRKQGRGTFVRETKIEPDISRLTSFTEDMLERGIAHSSKLLLRKIRHLPPAAAKRWNLPANEKMIVTGRLRYADGEPICINTSHIPLYLCPGLMEDNLENNSIKSLLGTKYGLEYSRADQTIEIAFASGSDAKLLKIPAGDPVFLVERVTYLEDGRFLDFTINIFRRDKYKFRIPIRR